jgi:hypothetical protein
MRYTASWIRNQIDRIWDALPSTKEMTMSDDVPLDQAAQLIADARVASLKLGIPPAEIAKIMMDEAILALMAERHSLSDIQATFKKYAKRDLPRFYLTLKTIATDQATR